VHAVFKNKLTGANFLVDDHAQKVSTLFSLFNGFMLLLHIYMKGNESCLVIRSLTSSFILA